MSDSFATPWAVARQAPLSMDFPGKSTGVGCHFLLHFPLILTLKCLTQVCCKVSPIMDCLIYFLKSHLTYFIVFYLKVRSKGLITFRLNIFWLYTKSGPYKFQLASYEGL